MQQIIKVNCEEIATMPVYEIFNINKKTRRETEISLLYNGEYTGQFLFLSF